MKKEIRINGMHCEGCVNRVKNVMESLDGIESCVVSLENQKAVIEINKNIEDEIIKEKLENANFEVINILSKKD